MQTFLTSYDLTENARVLDNKRLFKQLLEGYQILNVLVSGGAAWSNHPAVRQWRGYEGALVLYMENIWQECQSRGIAKKSQLINKARGLFAEKITSLELPSWFGRTDITDSHKNRLLCKGEIDSICAGLKKAHNIKKLDDWLKPRFKKTKNQLKYTDIQTLKSWLTSAELQSLSPNHYNQFNWNVGMNKEYVWPV